MALLFISVEVRMHCTNCAAEVPEQRKFCRQCGAAVVRRCLACGAANPTLSKFCGDCGTKLHVDSPAAVQAARDSSPKTSAQSSPATGAALLKPLPASTALSRDIMGTVRWSILAILRRTKTTRSAPFKLASHW